MKLPGTINNPKSFMASKPAGFDGIMAYEWVNDAWKDTRITGSDFDCILERNGHFCVIESKEPGVEIPQGQRITLGHLWLTGPWTIIITRGKKSPELLKIRWERDSGLGEEVATISSAEQATKWIKRWRSYAELYPNYRFMRNPEDLQWFLDSK